MNFNYTNLTNKELQTAMMGKKGEELKKDKEEKPVAGEPKSAVVDPKGEEKMETVAAAMENYAKGMMLQGPKSGSINFHKVKHLGGNANPSVVTPTGGDEPENITNIDDLIADWNANNKTMTREEKMALLTQIIDYYEAHADGDNVMIWRVRRYSTACDRTAENLAIYNNMLNGGEYSIPNSFGCDGYNGESEDREAMKKLNSLWNSGQCTDEQKIVYEEWSVAGVSTYTLLGIIECKNPNVDPGQIKFNRKQEKIWANTMLMWINDIVNNPINAHEPWRDMYNNYNQMFNNFRNSIDGLSHEEIQAMAVELQNAVEELSGQGFPYCDQLLISIQAYIAYAGYFGEPNVLPERLS